MLNSLVEWDSGGADGAGTSVGTASGVEEGGPRGVGAEEFPQEGERKRAGVGIVGKRSEGRARSNRNVVVGKRLHCEVPEICCLLTQRYRIVT